MYMIDEPSSYLDVRQRLKAAQVTGQISEYEAGRETRPDLVTLTSFMNPFPAFQLTACPAMADGCAGEDIDMGFVAPLFLSSMFFWLCWAVDREPHKCRHALLRRACGECFAV